MKPSFRGRLFWRVYLHGITLLLAVGVAVAILGVIAGSTPPWKEYTERLSAYLSADQAALLRQPEALAQALERERMLLEVEASVYRVDGTLAASNVQPPLPPLEADEVAELSGGPIRVSSRPLSGAVPIYSGTEVVAYAVGRASQRPHFARGLMLLAVVLVALALGSVPFVHGIVSPLEKLTATVRRFGEGDLSVRTGLRRRDEVGQLAKAFDEMATRIEALLRSEKELLANVSHELRTPLARIRVALGIAAEGDATVIQSYLAEIGTDLDELERLVDDVLTAARLELAAGRESGGRPPVRRELIAAREGAKAAASRFRALHPGRELKVSLSDDEAVVQADPTLLRRALDNLLNNAAKYSEKTLPVELSAEVKNGRWLVAVRDHGIGISAEDLPRLFTPFFRTDRSRARGTGGVGLGLVLARRIVEAHGGRLTAESQEGQGSVFRIEVPLEPAAQG